MDRAVGHYSRVIGHGPVAALVARWVGIVSAAGRVICAGGSCTDAYSDAYRHATTYGCTTVHATSIDTTVINASAMNAPMINATTVSEGIG
jgi:hypothetical protein